LAAELAELAAELAELACQAPNPLTQFCLLPRQSGLQLHVALAELTELQAQLALRLRAGLTQLTEPDTELAHRGARADLLLRAGQPELCARLLQLARLANT